MDTSGTPTGSDRGDLTFLTRRGCPICDEALDAVRRHARGSVVVVDIDLDLDLLERWDEQVPVVLDSAGRVLATGPLGNNRARMVAIRARWRRP